MVMKLCRFRFCFNQPMVKSWCAPQDSMHWSALSVKPQGTMSDQGGYTPRNIATIALTRNDKECRGRRATRRALPVKDQLSHETATISTRALSPISSHHGLEQISTVV